MSTIPDFMPELRGDSGRSPRHGGCLVQVASWLHDGSWNHGPGASGVHELFRLPSILVNDFVDSARRRALAPLAASLAGTVKLQLVLQSQLVPDYGALCMHIGRLDHARRFGDGGVYDDACDQAVASLEQFVRAVLCSVGHTPKPVSEQTWRELSLMSKSKSCPTSVFA